MGTTSVLTKAPQGSTWSYSFKSIDAAGTISVGFKSLKKDLVVIFCPPDAGAKKVPKSNPVVGIQVFDTAGGKNPYPKKAIELTQFGSPTDPKSDDKLILTINYSRLDLSVVKKLIISGMDATGTLVSTTIDLAAPKASTKKPFVYSAARATTKAYKLVLEIAEWPKGDPLISHG
jgi:hypothetical protein